MQKKATPRVKPEATDPGTCELQVKQRTPLPSPFRVHYTAELTMSNFIKPNHNCPQHQATVVFFLLPSSVSQDSGKKRDDTIGCKLNSTKAQPNGCFKKQRYAKARTALSAQPPPVSPCKSKPNPNSFLGRDFKGRFIFCFVNRKQKFPSQQCHRCFSPNTRRLTIIQPISFNHRKESGGGFQSRDTDLVVLNLFSVRSPTFSSMQRTTFTSLKKIVFLVLPKHTCTFTFLGEKCVS